MIRTGSRFVMSTRQSVQLIDLAIPARFFARIDQTLRWPMATIRPINYLHGKYIKPCVHAHFAHTPLTISRTDQFATESVRMFNHRVWLGVPHSSHVRFVVRVFGWFLLRNFKREIDGYKSFFGFRSRPTCNDRRQRTQAQ